jgi:hypothetical protein
MKKLIALGVAAAVLGAVSLTSVAYAAGTKVPAACEKIKDKKELAACVKKHTKS